MQKKKNAFTDKTKIFSFWNLKIWVAMNYKNGLYK